MAASDPSALDDLLATPAPMGDDDDDDAEDVDVDDDMGDDEFSMHADTALDPEADPDERKEALRMAILAVTRGS